MGTEALLAVAGTIVASLAGAVGIQWKRSIAREKEFTAQLEAQQKRYDLLQGKFVGLLKDMIKSAQKPQESSDGE